MKPNETTSGLDWKTFDNAREKAFQTKTKEVKTTYGTTIVRDTEKVVFFQMARASAINKKYFSGEDEETYFPNGGHFAKGEGNIPPYVCFGRLCFMAGDFYDNAPIQCHSSTPFVGNVARNASRDEVLIAFNGDEAKTDNFVRFCNEYWNFKKGRIHYTSGKGWEQVNDL